MEYENIYRLMQKLDELTNKTNAQKYFSEVIKRPELDNLTNQIDALRYLICDDINHFKSDEIISIDTYPSPKIIGRLEESFIPKDPLVFDEQRGLGTRINFKHNLEQVCYDPEIKRAHLVNIGSSSGIIRYNSKICRGKEKVNEQLGLEGLAFE
ncbi:MAG: hypothetical protein ABIF85_01915 [Nanoarchaeota archaeon]|nr:hypothetical protein [Nanoarchaeota archaeon]MBU4300026.1 hypothetical protein [Nanoarchaeota archaeon]MBU4451401.1 hypothetical protein [Nanoarchaeota archaeon]MCG2724195.1 hypothetical protein [archaeon]